MFPPLLSVKNSVATTNVSWPAPSDKTPALMSQMSSLCTEMQPGVRGRGVEGVLSDPFSVSNSLIKLTQLESFLCLVTVQPTLLYFCWVGTNWPARLLTTFSTLSPGSLSERSQSCRACSLRTLWVRQEVPSRSRFQWLLAGWPFWSGASPGFSSNVTLGGSSAAVTPLLGHCHPTVTRNMDLPDKPETAKGFSPKSFIYASQEGFS